MRIRVLAFGVLRKILPSTDFALDLAEPCAAGEVLDRLAAEHRPSAAPPDLWNSLAVAVNQHYASRSQPLAEGDELALLPPVSGGSSQPPVALTRDPIDSAAILATLRHPQDGAVTIFDGIVRDNSRGRKTRFLVYDSYEEMALRQMQQLAAQALQRFPVHEVAIVHRLGKLEIGESSVFIAVCSAHRAAAFDACREAARLLTVMVAEAQRGRQTPSPRAIGAVRESPRRLRPLVWQVCESEYVPCAAHRDLPAARQADGRLKGIGDD